MAGIQKNFSLPPALAKAWDEFNPLGSQEKSKNASGALFLFLAMPGHVQSVCCRLAYQPDHEKAKTEFLPLLEKTEADMALAHEIVLRAKAHAEASRESRHQNGT